LDEDSDMAKDYYIVLGVSRSADTKRIKDIGLKDTFLNILIRIEPGPEEAAW